MTMRVKKRNVLKAALAFITFLVVLRFGALLVESESSGPGIRKLKRTDNDLPPDFDKQLFVKTNDENNENKAMPIEQRAKMQRNVALDDHVKHFEEDMKPREPALFNKAAREKLLLKNEIKNTSLSSDSKYALDISSERMNRLFDILYEKEKKYGEIFDELNVASFQRLIDGRGDQDKSLIKFKEERDKFLKVENGKVRTTEKFLDFLHEKSDMHTFDNPRDDVVKAIVEKVLILSSYLTVAHLN
jgi:hypothetical protein